MEDPNARLDAHLATWLGLWPPPDGRLIVVGSAMRERPGWDGSVRPVIGVATPDAAVLSVPPDLVAAVRALGTTLEAIIGRLPAAIGRPGAQVSTALFRWSTSPTSLPDAGVWVATIDDRVPQWLKPFNGEVLIAWDDQGRYGAGVGRKQHDRWGHELAVVTEPAVRGRGVARALVSQAARRVLDDGAVPTYLHDVDNVASAHVADASGFPDRGWRFIGLVGGGLPPP